MKWKQAVDNLGNLQTHGIQSVGHDYRIGRFVVDDGALATIYGLWRGTIHLGYFPDPAEAKDAAESDLLSLR